uniref:Uncharacterized protein n=1 Tax=Brassica oleracea var. oleracea TaxID=109376 RepID=A0A0D3BLD0_BRAOL
MTCVVSRITQNFTTTATYSSLQENSDIPREKISDDIPTKQVLGNNSSEIYFSSEIPRKFPTEFRGNKFPRTTSSSESSSEYTEGELPRDISMDFPMVQSSEVPTKCSSEFSSGISEELSPRKIPRNESLGIFRGRSPSVYSEENFLGNFRGEDSHDRALKPTPQHPSLPEDPEEQERVQQREREKQERVQQREMYGRSCGVKENPENGWNPETGSPFHHDHDAVEAGSDHHETYEAAQAIPDDSQPHQLLPSDSSQYKLQELPPNATSRQQQHWRDQSIKTNNDMLHKIWAAISRIRPCRCQKDDVVHRDNSPSSSGSGSSGTHRVRKRSKRPNDAEHLEQETRSRSYHRLFYFLFYSNVLWSYFLLILN